MIQILHLRRLIQHSKNGSDLHINESFMSFQELQDHHHTNVILFTRKVDPINMNPSIVKVSLKAYDADPGFKIIYKFYNELNGDDTIYAKVKGEKGGKITLHSKIWEKNSANNSVKSTSAFSWRDF